MVFWNYNLFVSVFILGKNNIWKCLLVMELKNDAHVDKCTSVSGNAARWAAEVLIDDLKVLKK